MRERRTESALITVFCVVLVAYAAWWSTLGITFSDDGYYVAAAMRFAQGARMFSDELFVQSLAALFTGPIAWLWYQIAGTSYLALVLRLVYVAIAAGTAWAVHRTLRDRFGVLASATAVIALVVAPPFNIPSLSYNSMSMLALVGSFACALCAVWANRVDAGGDLGAIGRDGGDATSAGGARAIDPSAAGSAALGVLAAVAYPPLGVAAVVLLAAVALRTRTRSVLLGLVTGGVGAIALVAGWFAFTTSIRDIAATLDFAAAQRVLETTQAEQAATLGRVTRATLAVRDLWPMWAAAFVATVAPQQRVRALAVATVPLLAALPGARALAAGGETRAFGVIGAAYLILAAAGLLLPVLSRVLRSRDESELTLVLLGLPTGVVGFVAVGSFTQSGWYWGMPFIGAAPLVLTALVIWGAWVRRELGVVAAAVLSVSLVGLLAAALWFTPFKSPRHAGLTETIGSGAYAGLRVERGREQAILELQQAGQKWVGENDRVLVINGPGVYPLVGGRIETPAIWLSPGGASAQAVAYFERRDSWPDVVFVTPDPADIPAGDALVDGIEADYQRVGEAAGFAILVKR